MASAISESQIVGFAIEGKHTKDEAIAMAQRLGLDHVIVARALGVDLPRTREEAEAKEPPAWTVTARGIRPKGQGTPDGKEFPFVWAGGFPWTVKPSESSTCTLTESQMRRVRGKEAKGKVIVLKAEKIRQNEEPPKAQPQAQQQQNARR